MTIEELVLVGLDNEDFAKLGEVVIEMPDDKSRYATASARYDGETKVLVITVA